MVQINDRQQKDLDDMDNKKRQILKFIMSL